LKFTLRCFIFASGVINWANKKQTYVVFSSTKNEYIALSKAIVKVIWL
jgi:hypothetical protein